MSSILRDWVVALPLREQGTLLMAIRGCDVNVKSPATLEAPERLLVAAIRYAVLRPADEREVSLEPGCWMQKEPPAASTFKVSALGHYPQHWVAHVMHAVEVLGYRHPDQADRWLSLYKKFCHSLHVNPETCEQMIERLGEDRIANGTVVS